ncbi:MAG: AtpZ/AtpI family protein [Acidobacteriota bacterium]|jgi:F0F1-type ATP synthase assembly protein I|nr:AtpZ/AtpI family protein [Acidobacteriota bacterium]
MRMPDENPKPAEKKAEVEAGDAGAFLAKSLQHMQEGLRQSGPAAMAGYTLIGAILLLGGVGYAVDRRFGTSPWFLLAGLLAGVVVGFVELAKIVWRK